MKIIKKDIKWLKERVSDVDYVLDIFDPLFTRYGGYIAGGFVRRCIKAGSAKKAMTDYPTHSKFDIDFFFPSAQRVHKAMKYVNKNLRWSKEVTLSGYDAFNVEAKYDVPNSLLKFAYEWPIEKWCAPEYDTAGGVYMRNVAKLQVIAEAYGEPEKVFNNFDLANCKIAFNKNHVWIREGWEELENEKKIHIDSTRGSLLLWRVAKYLSHRVHGNNWLDWSLTEESKSKLLEWTLHRMSTNEWGNLKGGLQHAKVLVAHDGGFNIKDLPFFFQKLGQINIQSAGDYYNRGSLSKEHSVSKEDFVAHHLKKRMNGKKIIK
tara:strand:+ start:2453 stop:3409 length:957 start_codon:yes stop_codon:yes gene_type:complete